MPMSPKKSPCPFFLRKGRSLASATELSSRSGSKLSPPEAWKHEMDAKDRTIASEYGECTRTGCSFQFCTNCLNGRHASTVCPVKPLTTSPTTSDEDSPQKTNLRRNSRKALRRLRN